ncbi:MAG: glycosyltransferase family 39 protein [Candidatus Moraniibacteriota bacterium]
MSTQRRLVSPMLLGFGAIILLAFFLRFYNIENLPAGLYPDEAMNGTNAITANETGDYKLFYEENSGREGLFINLQALALRTFGYTIPALKLWSAIFGTLTALGIGLLAWELFSRRSAALIAAFITATSYWAINFSRIGFRAIMTSFLLSFSFYFFFRGLRTRKILPFLLAGGIFGLGVHTYIAFRAAPVILILLLPFLMLSYENFLKHYWKHALAFVFAAFITASPMFYDFYQNPHHFSDRSEDISIFSPKVNHGDLFGTLSKTIGLSLIKYNFVGDQNFRHNYAPYPILDPIIGTFFLAGFLFLLGQTWRLLRARIQRKEYHPHLARNALLFIIFFVMLAPEYLTNESLPHALRSIGTQVPVFLFATFPVLFLFNLALRNKGSRKIVFLSFIILALGTSALWNTVKYFSFFAHHPKQYSSFGATFKNMAQHINTAPEETRMYLHANTGYIDLQAILFQTYHQARNFTVLKPGTSIIAPAEIIMMRFDEDLYSRIKVLSPQAYTETIPSDSGYADFKTIVIPGVQK